MEGFLLCECAGDTRKDILSCLKKNSQLPTQGAIVGVNVFYFVRIIRGSDPSSKGQSGYASFPEGSPSDQPYQGDEGDKQYTPPEY